ncbi:MAG: GNAT family N-acetyltransferase [Pseudomonadota bacterium]
MEKKSNVNKREQMAITLRKPEPSDKESWFHLFEEYLTFYKTKKPQEVFEANWNRILAEDTKMHSVLAFDGASAVGLANYLYHDSFWEVNERCYLNDLIVLPAARGKGVGEALIQYVFDESQTAGAAMLYWTTAHENVVARKLYDRVSELTPFIKYQKTK